ncbi:uncharacterized protein LOC127507812 [Ctenopharyngodon idella]|uniref:uncharacterized protein LOC127507812 n=1 Tax=Ctenopharyngodon idella TaxID=7959 RepID=UPI0022311897|nr:uncharacterized protein LOC127507812 [Ctenopharyngodon idella]
MRQILKSMRRGVVAHQAAVKASKEERVISKATLRKCRELSKQAIPELLAALESTPTAKNLWRFYGYFSAFLASIYGHRGGVYQNMTIQEVEGARKSTSEKSYVINIESHRTNQAYGPAQVALLEEEYEWSRRFLALRNKLPGGKAAKHFFFTSTPNPCKNLNSYFQEAWKEMKLPGCPTFTDLRTSIASHAKYTRGEEDRMKVAKFMCHDVRTADKFYAMNLTAKQAMEHRRLFEGALEGPDLSPIKPTTPAPSSSSRRKTSTPRRRILVLSSASASSTSSSASAEAPAQQ